MPKNNVVKFPAKRHSESHNAGVCGPSQPVWRSRFLQGSRWLARRLIVALARKALLLVALAIFVTAWLARLGFGILSLGFLGKLWLHWGTPSAWTPALELCGSLLIFCAASALLAWFKTMAPATPAPVLRLSLLDRLLLLSRR